MNINEQNNMQVRITPREQEVYDYIIEFMEKNLFSPTVREIMVELKFQSTSSVHYHIKNLEKHGYITVKEGEPRTIRPVGYKLVKIQEENTGC